MSVARRNPQLREVGAWRRRLVVGLLGAGVLVVVGRAFELQVIEREFLTSEGNKRAIRTLTVEGHRGVIRDRNGEPLAMSAPVDSVWAVPSAVLSKPEYVAPLARLLGESEAALTKTLEARRNRQFLYLRRQMNPADAARIQALGAPGIFVQREYRRYYPAAEVAGNVVGFTNIDGRGQEGIEAAQDARLRGEAGKRVVIRARDGRIVEDDLVSVPARRGDDIQLTLDLRLQYIAYRELKAAVQQHGARGGVIVVADPRTGEILAAANQPAFNPNRMAERASSGVRNRAATDLFEPGSSIKPLLVAIGLASGAYKPNSNIETGNGLLPVGRHLVKDKRAHGTISLSRMLTKSSNVGASLVGLKLGAERLYEGYLAFGLGAPVYSGFPGEGIGVLRHHADWRQIGTATASYGYGLSVTALHMVRAYSALATDGTLPSLHFMKGQELLPPQRAIPASVAQDMRHLMRGVVSADGTASRAQVSGYSVAGKTGTVRKSGAGGYSEDRHQGMFVGMLPASKPRIVVLVMIDEPGGDVYYGGLISAPAFSRVAGAAARLLGIPTDQQPGPEITVAHAQVQP